MCKTCSNVTPFILSTLFGCLLGIGVAEVSCNGYFSLIEIRWSRMFAIIYGIIFIILSVLFAWRIVKTISDLFKRLLFLVFTFAVFVGGILCLFLNQDWFLEMNLVEKICFYTLFGTIMSFVFTFSFIECVNLGVCDKCCHTDFQNYPLFHSRYQLVLLFSGVFTLGLVLGLLFGLMDLGNDDKVRDKLRFNLVYSLPFGGVLGSALGFFNQVIRRNQQSSNIEYQPIASSTHTET